MKQFLILLFLVITSINCFSQDVNYEMKQNIHYYADSINSLDEYINERCVLDIYYPKNVKNFATIVVDACAR